MLRLDWLLVFGGMDGITGVHPLVRDLKEHSGRQYHNVMTQYWPGILRNFSDGPKSRDVENRILNALKKGHAEGALAVCLISDPTKLDIGA